MIAFLRGKLTARGTDWAIIDVQGVGFRVVAPSSTLSRLPAPGEEAFLHTYLAVREDGMFLYGFAAEAELESFMRLLSVGGVGPRMALAVLSALTPGSLASAVATEHVEQLVRVPGVGKKTARRIILELKDKLPAIEVDGVGTGQPAADPGPESDAVNALVALGYGVPEASAAVRAAMAEERFNSTAGLVKSALKQVAAIKFNRQD
ncbi:MAG: Holliday junction branch migration protein RuvA [Bacillota bacterium]